MRGDNQKGRKMSQSPAARKRLAGFTLIEMLVAISVGTVLAAIGVGLIHSLMRLEQFARADFRWRMDCDRLAAQFREDCHAAPGSGWRGNRPRRTQRRCVPPRQIPRGPLPRIVASFL